MTLQVFKAPTMAAALAQVKTSLGHDAIILHTRTYGQRYCLGLRRKEIVEITAARGLRVGQRSRPVASTSPKPAILAGRSAYGSASHASDRAMVCAADVRPSFIDRPEVGNMIVRDLLKEVEAVKVMVKGLSTEIRHQHCPQVPSELIEYYQLMLANSVEEDTAVEVTQALGRTVRPEYLQRTDFVKDKLAEQIEKLVPVGGPITRTKALGPHVVALVGPTGVGKTTTIAKLAANLKVKEHRSVGFITLDTYRIAAVDQLKRYADILGAPLRICACADDLRSSIDQMSECDFLLVDSAGRSPNDTIKIGELRNFVRIGNVDEVHLVLSTTSSPAALDLAAQRFGDVRIDRVIFTKLDEAANVGALLSITRKLNKSLSYITTGQDVPHDIEVARGRRIAQLILGSDL